MYAVIQLVSEELVSLTAMKVIVVTCAVYIK